MASKSKTSSSKSKASKKVEPTPTTASSGKAKAPTSASKPKTSAKKKGDTPSSVKNLPVGEAWSNATTSTLEEVKAPKGTEYDDSTPEEDRYPIASTESSGVTIDEAPIIHSGTAVRLGKHKLVPERYEGVVAMVIEAPRYQCPGCDVSYRLHEHQPPDTVFTVRTRDDADTILSLPRDAFDKIAPEGRVGLLPHG